MSIRQLRYSLCLLFAMLLVLPLSLVKASTGVATSAPQPQNLRAYASGSLIIVYDIAESAIVRVYDSTGSQLGEVTYHRANMMNSGVSGPAPTRSYVSLTIAKGLTVGTAVYVSVQDVGKAESSKTAVVPELTKISMSAFASWKGTDLQIDVSYSSVIPKSVSSIDASQFTLALDATGQSIQAASSVAISTGPADSDRGQASASTLITITFSDFPDLAHDSNNGSKSLFLRYNHGISRRMEDSWGKEVKSPDTVSVSVRARASKAIGHVRFEDHPTAVPNVSETEKSVSLTVPFGTNLTALKPTIVHTGVSLSPASGIVQDFTNPVTYTVTAADGSIQKYTVTVTVESISSKAIRLFSIPGSTSGVTTAVHSISGVIDEGMKRIVVTLPYGRDVTALIPSIIHTGVSVSPAPKVAQDFSHPVTYKVKSGDGTTQDYVVTVTVTPYSAKSISSFSLYEENIGLPGVINENDKTILVRAQPGTNVSALKAALSFIGASVSPGPGVKQDFTKPVTYTVTAADGSTQSYVVTVETLSVSQSPAKPSTPTPNLRFLQATVGTEGYTVGGVRVPMAACYYRGTDTMMPIRMLDEFGVRLEWLEQTKTLTMWYKDKTIALTIGSTNAQINGVNTPIGGASGRPVTPELKQGRVMIPLRFVSENLGFKVEWTPDNVIKIFE